MIFERRQFARVRKPERKRYQGDHFMSRLKPHPTIPSRQRAINAFWRLAVSYCFYGISVDHYDPGSLTIHL